MKKKLGLVLALCALLPMNAMAVTEGVVEEAPMVEIRPAAQMEESYLPDASYYAGATIEPSWENAETWVGCEKGEDGLYCDVTQNPYLTAGEQKRARKLMEENVVYTGESVLEKTNDVIVGVYALDPADYDGETVFVILPGTCLTDDQLLSIIDAYDQLGLTFDPTSLNYRNCSRGGGIEATRFLNAEESERNRYLANLIRRGQLVPPENLNMTVRYPQLVSEYFCGLTDFTFIPYRAWTDEELVAMLVASGVRNETAEVNHSDIEVRSRTALYKVFRCPLSMTLEFIYTDGGYSPVFFTKDGQVGYDYADWKKAYGASFTYHTEDDILVYVHTSFDKETSALTSMSAIQDGNGPDQALVISESVTPEKVKESIAETAAFLNLTELDWHVMWDDETFTNWGLCIPVRAAMNDEWILTVYIGGDDGEAHGYQLDHGTLKEEVPTLTEGNNG